MDGQFFFCKLHDLGCRNPVKPVDGDQLVRDRLGLLCVPLGQALHAGFERRQLRIAPPGNAGTHAFPGVLDAIKPARVHFYRIAGQAQQVLGQRLDRSIETPAVALPQQQGQLVVGVAIGLRQHLADFIEQRQLLQPAARVAIQAQHALDHGEAAQVVAPFGGAAVPGTLVTPLVEQYQHGLAYPGQYF